MKKKLEGASNALSSLFDGISSVFNSNTAPIEPKIDPETPADATGSVVGEVPGCNRVEGSEISDEDVASNGDAALNNGQDTSAEENNNNNNNNKNKTMDKNEEKNNKNLTNKQPHKKDITKRPSDTVGSSADDDTSYDYVFRIVSRKQPGKMILLLFIMII